MARHFRVFTALVLIGVSGAGMLSAQTSNDAPVEPPDADYWVYVGAESADFIHRVRFGPDGGEVEQTTSIGRVPTEVEGPHGLVVAPDGEHLYMTTGHGVPDGHLWKFHVGPDTTVAEPILLGRFPATIDITPDGLYVFGVNFNLHGAMAPSTMSVVYTPSMVEVTQIELCTMPHGSRMHPRGTYVYTVCMMDDQLVEVNTSTFTVSRRFSVAAGEEGSLPDAPEKHHAHPPASPHEHEPDVTPEELAAHHASCSPTWAQPEPAGRRLYVACNAADHVLEIDVENWTLLRTLPSGRGPYNLAVSPDGRLLVVTLKQGDAVDVFDLESGESRARIPTSTRVVHGVVVSPDSRYAFVSVEGIGSEPGKVDVFDLQALQRVADIEVGQQASGIDFLRMQPRH